MFPIIKKLFLFSARIWQLRVTEFITYGLRKDVESVENPDSLEICVMRNGVEDILRVKLNSKEEKKELMIKIYLNMVIFSLPSENFAAAVEKSQPGTMMVVENGKCTLRVYYYKTAGIQPNYDDIDEHDCTLIKNNIQSVLASKDDETTSEGISNPENKVN